MQSSLSYEFSCAHCASKYVGSTIRASCSREAQHAGRSSGIGNSLVHPFHSSIRLHLESKCDVTITEDNFKVLSTYRCLCVMFYDESNFNIFIIYLFINIVILLLILLLILILLYINLPTLLVYLHNFSIFYLANDGN